MNIYHIYMYEERTAKSTPFHNRKQEIVFEYIIISFVLVLKEFKIIWAKELFKTRKKIICNYVYKVKIFKPHFL
jgi:hypothetical protein